MCIILIAPSNEFEGISFQQNYLYSPHINKKREKIMPIFSIRFSNDVDKKWIKLSKKKIYIIKREIKREKESIKKTRKFPRIDDFRELICFLHQFRLLLPNL